jgi:hypothetical protein
MTIPDHVRPDAPQMPDDLIVHLRRRKTLRLRHGELTQFEAAGPADVQLPWPRLQSIRMATLPSAPKAIVYFDPSSGVSVVPLAPQNATSCHDVPASGEELPGAV